MFALNIILSEVVNLLLLVLVIWKRRKRMISCTAIVWMFFFGILTGILNELMIVKLFGNYEGFRSGEALIVGFIDEFLRGLISFLFIIKANSRLRARFEKIDGIFYGIVPALGFSFIQHIMWGASDLPPAYIIRRNMRSMLNASYGVLIGIFIILAMEAATKRKGKQVIKNLAAGYVIVSVMHSINSCPWEFLDVIRNIGLDPEIIASMGYLLNIALVVFCIVYSVKQYKAARKKAKALRRRRRR